MFLALVKPSSPHFVLVRLPSRFPSAPSFPTFILFRYLRLLNKFDPSSGYPMSLTVANLSSPAALSFGPIVLIERSLSLVFPP